MEKTPSVWLDPNFASKQYKDGRPDYPIEFLSTIKEYIFKGRPEPPKTVAFNIGCGPGKASLALSRLFSNVYASDPSTAQISQAPTIDNVVHETFRSEKIIEKYEAHIADLIFFGLSFQFTGVRAGTKCSKHILKIYDPSLMAAAGYHFSYILDPEFLPVDAYHFFKTVETNKIHHLSPGINNSPVFSENITQFYPDHTHKSLYGIRHYHSLPGPSDHLDKFIGFLIHDRVASRRDEEFMYEEIDFKYKKKIYFHTIEKTNLHNILQNILTWDPVTMPEQKPQFRIYCDNFYEQMCRLIGNQNINQPIYQGRIYYAYLCSDNIKFS